MALVFHKDDTDKFYKMHASKDNSSDKDKTAKDKETKAPKSVFFSKSSAPAAADPDSDFITNCYKTAFEVL